MLKMSVFMMAFIGVLDKKKTGFQISKNSPAVEVNPRVGWVSSTRFSYKSQFQRGFGVGINRVISIFTHALFVCVGHKTVIFDTKKSTARDYTALFSGYDAKSTLLARKRRTFMKFLT